jgi:hypothetical protein
MDVSPSKEDALDAGGRHFSFGYCALGGETTHPTAI